MSRQRRQHFALDQSAWRIESSSLSEPTKIDTGELAAHLPQPLCCFRISRGCGALDFGWRPCEAHHPCGSEIFAALDIRIGRRAQARRGAHRGILRDDPVADLQDEGFDLAAAHRRAFALELGRRVTGVARKREQGWIRWPFRFDSTLKFEREEQVRELALPVGCPLVVTTLAHQIVEVDPPHAMCVTRDGHDARISSRDEAIEEQSGQREMSEVVRAKLHLEAIVCRPERDGHEPGVVDEHIEAIVLAQECLCKRANAGAARQIEAHDLREGVGTFRS